MREERLMLANSLKGYGLPQWVRRVGGDVSPVRFYIQSSWRSSLTVMWMFLCLHVNSISSLFSALCLRIPKHSYKATALSLRSDIGDWRGSPLTGCLSTTHKTACLILAPWKGKVSEAAKKPHVSLFYWVTAWYFLKKSLLVPSSVTALIYLSIWWAKARPSPTPQQQVIVLQVKEVANKRTPEHGGWCLFFKILSSLAYSHVILQETLEGGCCSIKRGYSMAKVWEVFVSTSLQNDWELFLACRVLRGKLGDTWTCPVMR